MHNFKDAGLYLFQQDDEPLCLQNTMLKQTIIKCLELINTLYCSMLIDGRKLAVAKWIKGGNIQVYLSTVFSQDRTRVNMSGKEAMEESQDCELL